MPCSSLSSCFDSAVTVCRCSVLDLLHIPSQITVEEVQQQEKEVEENKTPEQLRKELQELQSGLNKSRWVS